VDGVDGVDGEREVDETQVDETQVDETQDEDALVSQLRLIEDQPLDQRADSYAELHTRLRERLEGSDGGTVD
jgi:hypothetical protein